MTITDINEKSTGFIRKCREHLEKKQLSKENTKKKAYFLWALEEAKRDVALKRNHFENVTEAKLLDCCILELTAAESRLNYYLSLAKREKMVNDEYLDVYFFSKKGERGAAI